MFGFDVKLHLSCVGAACTAAEAAMQCAISANNNLQYDKYDYRSCAFKITTLAVPSELMYDDKLLFNPGFKVNTLVRSMLKYVFMTITDD